MAPGGYQYNRNIDLLPTIKNWLLLEILLQKQNIFSASGNIMATLTYRVVMCSGSKFETNLAENLEESWLGILSGFFYINK